jgi:hypothetical protein
MALGLTTAQRNSMVQVIQVAVDASSTGTLKLYTTPQPATGGSVGGATLLATFSIPNPSAPSASGGVLTFNAISPVTAGASGTAIWGRFQDGSTAFVADCTVGTSGTDIVLSTNILTSGLQVSITAATITAGNS